MAWVFYKKRVVVPEGLRAFGNTRLQVLRSLFLINSLTEIDSVEIGYGPGLHNQRRDLFISNPCQTSNLRLPCYFRAKRSGYQQITLTTFRTVPWNMPFYTRLGFVEIPTHELRPELETVVRDEGSRGLDREQRVVMRYLMNVVQPVPR